MSKVSFSRELLGTIRFIFDKTKSRTLNATQAYDKSTSQIVLGSFPASASKKLLTKDLGAAEEYALGRIGTAAVTLTTGGAVHDSDLLEKANRDSYVFGGIASANVSFSVDLSGGTSGLKKSNGTRVFNNADVVSFTGASLFPGATRSNATKEIYYGAFTVGTGEYREWQGKYAILKVDLLTNNAILRVYNQ